MGRAFRPASVVSVLVLTACGAGDSASERATAVTYDSAGVTIVESAEPLWSDTTRWAVADEPELSIGVVDGDPAYQFNRIDEVVRTSSGRILVANGGSNEVQEYDPDGRHVRTYGGAGEGPGEFQALAGFVARPDTVLVFDPALMRLTPFDSSGRVGETVPLEPTGDPIHPLRLYRLEGLIDGDLVMAVRGFPADMRPEPIAYWDTLPTLLYDRQGALLGTIGEYAGMDTYSTPRRSGSFTFARDTST